MTIGASAMLTRRQFLTAGAAGFSCLSLGGRMPVLFARAADAAARQDRNDRVLVVVELAGGNDGLNTVMPFEDPLYAKHRPTLAIPKDQVVKLTDHVGLHPALGPLGKLFKAGNLAVVQGVGYPDPDRSHFRSMEIWHTASTAPRPPSTGWLGRVLDAEYRPGDEERVRALGLADGLPQALQSDRVPVPVVQQLDAFTAPEEGTARQKLLRRLSTMPGDRGQPVGFLRRQAATLYRTADRLRAAAEKYRSDAEYTGNLGEQLRKAAQLTTADVGVRLLFVSQGSYDTHNQQAGAHQALLTELAANLAAFQQDLVKQKCADRVLVLTFSEFGRRVDENASRGTDHGAASCLFLGGTKVKGGLAGTYPSLAKLGEGDLIHTVDFRSVYATVLERWLGCAAEPLLGGKYPLLDVIAT
jgi:uncharacterized protein (DUF1501 family)